LEPRAPDFDPRDLLHAFIIECDLGAEEKATRRHPDADPDPDLNAYADAYP
jgi:hypothetical protein